MNNEKLKLTITKMESMQSDLSEMKLAIVSLSKTDLSHGDDCTHWFDALHTINQHLVRMQEIAVDTINFSGTLLWSPTDNNENKSRQKQFEIISKRLDLALPKIDQILIEMKNKLS